MRNLPILGCVLFWIVATIFWVRAFIYDMQHRELWDRDFNHDPRVYVPVIAAVVAAAVLLLCWMIRLDRKDKDRLAKW